MTTTHHACIPHVRRVSCFSCHSRTTRVPGRALYSAQMFVVPRVLRTNAEFPGHPAPSCLSRHGRRFESCWLRLRQLGSHDLRGTGAGLEARAAASWPWLPSWACSPKTRLATLPRRPGANGSSGYAPSRGPPSKICLMLLAIVDCSTIGHPSSLRASKMQENGDEQLR